MNTQLTERQVLQLRLVNQRLRLIGEHKVRGLQQVAEVAHSVCGLQAQDMNAAALSIRARGQSVSWQDVYRARIEERSIVRTWLMRGTLHLVAANDLSWLVELLGPVFIRSNRRRRESLGLDEQTGEQGVKAARKLLAENGPLTRNEIRPLLAAVNIPVDGQALIHLLALAALQGWVCYGPDRGKELSFVLVSDWVKTGSLVEPGYALRELVRRFLSAYAPAGPEDFSAWSGLPLRQAREGWKSLADEMEQVELVGTSMWMLKSQADLIHRVEAEDPIVTLLPAFDTYLLGYRTREPFLALQHSRRIFPGGGIIHPALLVNGKVLGRWKIKHSKKILEVQVEPFEELPGSILDILEREVLDIGKFYSTEAKLSQNCA